jgi:hypothetical protein
MQLVHLQHRKQLPDGRVPEGWRGRLVTMKAEDKKKLALKTETVRALTRDELVGIQGAGFTDVSGSCSCESCICSYWGNCGPSK